MTDFKNVTLCRVDKWDQIHWATQADMNEDIIYEKYWESQEQSDKKEWERCISLKRVGFG